MKMKTYRSPYEAYPFLSDEANDLRCDFELLTDEIASQIGLLRSKVKDLNLKDELLWLDELVYHINPSLRTSLKITKQEEEKLKKITQDLKNNYSSQVSKFVIPQGSENAMLAHLLRVQFKKLVRLIYRYLDQGNEVSPRLIDIANILSGYFFYLALKLNDDEGIKEIEFNSRNY